MKTLVKSLSFRYLKKADADLGSCKVLTSQKYWRNGSKMNTDLALTLMGSLGLVFGFLLGYAKGHEHGKIAGRVAYSRQQRQLQQVNR